MANGSNENVPITSAISNSKPTPKDIALTEKLKLYIKKLEILETDQETQHRILVLSKLNQLFREFVITVGIKKVFLSFIFFYFYYMISETT